MMFNQVLLVLATLDILTLHHLSSAFVIINSQSSQQRIKTRQPSSQYSQLRLRQFHAVTTEQVYDDDDNHSIVEGSSTSVQFAMDPYDDRAKVIMQRLGMTSKQHQKLADLASLVVEWNQRLNLISRRDCTVPVVFGRHILPSLSLHQVILNTIEAIGDNKENTDDGTNPPSSAPKSLRIVDVGTGGGFPGLPLAIALPHAQILCVDSVGKKIRTVQAMADALRLSNVQTFSGRAEEMVSTQREQELLSIGKATKQSSSSSWEHGFDLVIGRSVTALPNFCSWIQDLINPTTGRLLYIIGGDIDDDILQQVQFDLDINQLFMETHVSDKRVLVLDAKAVKAVAATMAPAVEVATPKRSASRQAYPKSNNNSRPQPRRVNRSGDEPRNNERRRGRTTKGDESSEADYSNFKRYNNI